GERCRGGTVGVTGVLPSVSPVARRGSCTPGRNTGAVCCDDQRGGWTGRVSRRRCRGGSPGSRAAAGRYPSSCGAVLPRQGWQAGTFVHVGGRRGPGGVSRGAHGVAFVP